MKRVSLRVRLALFHSAVLCVMLAVFGMLFYHALGLFVEQSLTNDLHAEATFLQNNITVNNGQLHLILNPTDRERAYLIQVATRYYQVFKLPAGKLIVQSEELDLLGIQPTAEQALALAKRRDDTDVTLPSDRLRFHNLLVPSDDGISSFLVRVGIPLSPADAARRGFLRSLLFMAPVGVVFAGLVGWQLTKRALRPMKSLAAAARNINIQHLRQRLPVQGAGDEVDDLAQAFNETLARLDNSVEQMKQFTASIAHELRTPLTALRGEAEVALLEAHSVEEYRNVLASQLEEFDKLAQMVNQLLILARAEAGEILWTDQRVDLSVLAASLVEQMEPMAAAKNVTIETMITPRIFVSGDSNWLERVILNLLDNAIKFNGEDSKARVQLTSEEDYAVLRVDNSGVGIPPEAIPHVFERFFRAEPSRSKHVEGVGLGLALAKWIVDRHHGTIEAESWPGVGSRFTVRLPLSTLKTDRESS